MVEFDGRELDGGTVEFDGMLLDVVTQEVWVVGVVHVACGPHEAQGVSNLDQVGRPWCSVQSQGLFG